MEKEEVYAVCCPSNFVDRSSLSEPSDDSWTPEDQYANVYPDGTKQKMKQKTWTPKMNKLVCDEEKCIEESRFISRMQEKSELLDPRSFQENCARSFQENCARSENLTRKGKEEKIETDSLQSHSSKQKIISRFPGRPLHAFAAKTLLNLTKGEDPKLTDRDRQNLRSRVTRQQLTKRKETVVHESGTSTAEEESDEEEPQIRVGHEYQATIPDICNNDEKTLPTETSKRLSFEKVNIDNSQFVCKKWNNNERAAFIVCIHLFGKDFPAIAKVVKTRNVRLNLKCVCACD